MRKYVPFLFLLAFFISAVSGCKIIHIEEEPTNPVKYTIVKASEIPEAAAALIDEKKKEEFELTYQVGEDFYLIKGYGQQMTGGYSIQVKELSASSNALFLKTCLLGPEEKPQHSEPSYPYIIVKTKYTVQPVQFETVLCREESINS